MALEEVGVKRLGTTIRDKWVLEELIGVGGMASVYVARHKIGRREAIKILHPDIASSEQLRARFEQEALAVNAFRHPGVVEVRDFDVTDDGAPFLVMELLEGEPLSDRAKRPPPLAPGEVLRLASEVLDVLAAAHARQIIHRDIKPDNLFVLRDGKIKVLDFGIAQMRSGLSVIKRTQVGVTLGTMAYMPPEQARGQEIDGRADVYAVGATIFRLLAGRIVHNATTDAELVMMAVTEPAPRLSTVVGDLSPSICSIVDRALAYDLADRYPSAVAMRDDIAALLAGSDPPYASSARPIPARPASARSFSGPATGAFPALVAPPVVDTATFVPRAKQDTPVTPAMAAPAAPAPPVVPAVQVPVSTRVGTAPEVMPTMLAASIPIPSAAVRSGPAPISNASIATAAPVGPSSASRVLVTSVATAGGAPRTVVSVTGGAAAASAASAAPARAIPVIALLAAIAALVVILLGVVIYMLVSSGGSSHDASGDDFDAAAAAATSSPMQAVPPTARPPGGKAKGKWK